MVVKSFLLVAFQHAWVDCSPPLPAWFPFSALELEA